MNDVINIDLDSYSEYINDYDDDRINIALHEYIINSIKNIKNNIILKINFHFSVPESEKEKIKKMIQDDFEICLKDINREFKKISIQNVLLALLGIIFLGIYWYLEKFNVFIISEFCLIFSWVVFWEITERILFLRRNLIMKRKKCEKVLSAKFEFN